MYKVIFRFEGMQNFEVFEFENGEQARQFGLFLKRLAVLLKSEIEIGIERKGERI